MELPPSSSVISWSACCILSVVSVLCFGSFAGAIVGNETDRLALLEFKAKITNDPFMVLSSWNHTIHFCQWHGVTCGRRHQRITELQLPSLELMGTISPFIGNLSFLRLLDLKNNSFIHEIPPEIGRLHRLETLALYNNSIGGIIPSNLSGCSNLQFLDLGRNQLVGGIPVELGSLSKLRRFSASRNKLTGSIPAFLGNLSSLEVLTAIYNYLSGSIPDALGQLTNLKYIALAANKLFGTFPPSIFNLSSITTFEVGSNQIQGSLPLDLGITLPNLEYFSIDHNQFSGSIPPSISNASNLNFFQIGSNKITGNVPSLEKLHRLQSLLLTDNQLGKGEVDDLSFLFSLTNATSLKQLYINNNNFGGVLPKCIGNFSFTLRGFVINTNKISGMIPSGITKLVNLETLEMASNQLSGNIPPDIGKLQRLQVMYMQENNLSGFIPRSLGNLTLLLKLSFGDNSLQGSIPSSLGNCQILGLLDLSQNNLTGTIPSQVIGLSSLFALDLSGNHFTGLLPMEVGKMINLGILNVSKNMLSGEIPSSLGSCIKLELLAMQRNLFRGTIPSSFRVLRGLQTLDLSHNNLSGTIPDFFVDFNSLKLLNLAYNNLVGLVPVDGVFKNSSITSVVGNNHLCGGISEMQLPKCKSEKKKMALTAKLIIVIVFGLLGVTSVLSFVFLCWSRKKRKEPISSSSGNLLFNASYQSLLRATDGFSLANLLGVGSFGSVYKGVLDEGRTAIAVKVLNLLRPGASKSFLAECETLRNIRHRNLLKVLTVCSGVDYNGNDFKALVYEFMINGSLEDWLHPKAKEDEVYHVQRNLNFSERLNVAIDVASALEYLHYHCPTPIVHCDLKPSNVLLDDEMTGHVGDFGLARFSTGANHDSSNNHSSSIGIRGTIGYTAPEYGMGNEVSTYGDVYSYGILLLEMFTRKRPTDDVFRGTQNLYSFVKTALPQYVVDIADPILLLEKGNTTLENATNETRARRNKIQECLIMIFGIGVACSAEQPGERMSIRDVVAELHSIRKMLLETGAHGQGQPTDK